MYGYHEDHVKGYDQACIEQMIQYEIMPHHCMVEASDHGHDEAPNCLLEMSQTKWCVDFHPMDTWIVFKFRRPIWFRGYAFKFGDDFEQRDPMVWEIKTKDCQAHFTKLNPDHHHVELHDAEHRPIPKRNTFQEFCMNQPVWTDEIKFTFHRTREEGNPIV